MITEELFMPKLMPLEFENMTVPEVLAVWVPAARTLYDWVVCVGTFGTVYEPTIEPFEE